MLCDLNIAQIILDFAVGGISLRVIIALLKNLLHLDGILAMLLSVVCSFVATGIYLLVIGSFSWICLIVIGFTVYAGSQVTYRLTKPQAQIVQK